MAMAARTAKLQGAGKAHAPQRFGQSLRVCTETSGPRPPILRRLSWNHRALQKSSQTISGPVKTQQFNSLPSDFLISSAQRCPEDCFLEPLEAQDGCNFRPNLPRVAN